MQVSPRGLAFIALHEGFVRRAYKDPVGIVTIGTGFTNLSREARAILGPIRMGMTITKEKNDQVLRQVLAKEFVPPVLRNIAPKQQNHLDAAASVSFNAGPKSTTWQWARALRAGDVLNAARILRGTATTARGRRLPGLVRRRSEEARLLEKGIYTGVKGFPTYGPSPTVVPGAPDDILIGYQKKLKALGYYKGVPDGLRGPKLTDAVTNFQRAHPQLIVDGILGRATMAQIDRVTDLKRKSKNTTLGGIFGTGTSSPATAAAGYDWAWALYAGAILTSAVLIYLAWQYRDELRTFFGRSSDDGEAFIDEGRDGIEDEDRDTVVEAAAAPAKATLTEAKTNRRVRAKPKPAVKRKPAAKPKRAGRK